LTSDQAQVFIRAVEGDRLEALYLVAPVHRRGPRLARKDSDSRRDGAGVRAVIMAPNEADLGS
jgi:hypothetical protein